MPPVSAVGKLAGVRAYIGMQEAVRHLERRQVVGVEDLALADDEPVAVVAGNQVVDARALPCDSAASPGTSD
jgi:predicted nucleotidyltransferase